MDNTVIKEKYAVVVGGVNIDIGGQSLSPLVGRDSNPGHVAVSVGGVGRNIAHNMTLLGMKVCLLTAFGDDIYARKIIESCEELGIDTSAALQVPGEATSTYLYINDNDGDMAVAVSDMAICGEITAEYLAEHEALLNGAEIVVADANIPASSLVWLAGHCEAPLFVDPVSTRKAGKLKPLLKKIHTMKPNLIEAGVLSGIKITDDATLWAAAKTLLARGLRRVFITLGAGGVLAAEGDEVITVPCFPGEPVNTTGAGDAFMAALAWAWPQDLGLAETCRFALAAASIAGESPGTINPEMSAEAVAARAQQFRKEQQI